MIGGERSCRLTSLRFAQNLYNAASEILRELLIVTIDIVYVPNTSGFGES